MGNAMTEAHRDEDLYGERHDEKPTPAPAKNPKTAIGRTKPAMVSVIPTASLLHLGEVMKLGATKSMQPCGTCCLGSTEKTETPRVV